MQVDEDFENILGDSFEFGFGEAVAFVDVLTQRVGGDKALNKGEAFAVFGFNIEVVEVAGDGRMAERVECVGFALKEFDGFPFKFAGEKDELDDDEGFGLAIACLISLLSVAIAELLLNDVALL